MFSRQVDAAIAGFDSSHQMCRPAGRSTRSGLSQVLLVSHSILIIAS